MRLETLEKEADLYGGDNECYVHIECLKNTNMKVIINGDPAALMAAGYVLILEIAKKYNIPPQEILKYYKKSLKMFGSPEVIQENE